jgi:hypothetical protein
MKKSVFDIMRKEISLNVKRCPICGSNELIRKVNDIPKELMEGINVTNNPKRTEKIGIIYCEKCRHFLLGNK